MEILPVLMNTAVAAEYMGKPTANAFRQWAKKYDDFPVRIDGLYAREQLDGWWRRQYGDATGSDKSWSRRTLDEKYGLV